MQPFAHILENHVLGGPVDPQIKIEDESSLKEDPSRNRQDDNDSGVPMFASVRHRTVVNSSALMRNYLVTSAGENLKDLLYGNIASDKKGCTHWIRLVNQYREHVDNVEVTHSTKLGELRDFWSFVLTIWQVLTWPATFMTGYW